jgi:hypothetical protein
MNTLHIELIERLNTAAQTAAEIHEADRKRVEELKYHLRELMKDLKEAERTARQSGNQYRKLARQIGVLAKRHNVTSIRYDMHSHTSRASIG